MITFKAISKLSPLFPRYLHAQLQISTSKFCSHEEFIGGCCWVPRCREQILTPIDAKRIIARPCRFVHQNLPWISRGSPLAENTRVRAHSLQGCASWPLEITVTVPAKTVAKLIIMPSIPTSPLRATSGGACGS